MSAPKLIQEEPPPSRTNRAGIRSGNPDGSPPGPMTLWLWEIRKRPGVWFRYPEQVSANTPRNVRIGNHSGVDAGEFEATGRGWTKDRKCTLYARWVGNR